MRTVLTLFVVLLAGAGASAQSTDDKVAQADRVWIACQIYSAVNAYFGHWRGVPDLDWDKEFRAYVAQIVSTDDRRAFDLASMEFLAKLKNGHSGFRDKWLEEQDGQHFGFYAYPVGGAWVVVRSRLATLRPGDIVTRIDGRRFSDFYQTLRKYISASDERWAQRSFFEYPYLFPKSFALELADGRTVQIDRGGAFRRAGEDDHEIVVRDERASIYIKVPSFADPGIEKAALDAVQKAGAAKALIVDVRGNHGGSTPTRLTAKLMDRPYRWFEESTPSSIAVFKYWGYLGGHSELRWYGDVTKPEENSYRGAVFILVDGGCFSACEDFVVPFKDNHRAMLIGERTAGSSGQPFSQDFGNGMGIGLSTKREFLPDGSTFEGVGVVPDVEVQTSAEDFRTERDPVLERATAMIRELLNKP